MTREWPQIQFSTFFVVIRGHSWSFVVIRGPFGLDSRYLHCQELISCVSPWGIGRIKERGKM